jgi:hypothetical protein
MSSPFLKGELEGIITYLRAGAAIKKARDNSLAFSKS